MAVIKVKSSTAKTPPTDGANASILVRGELAYSYFSDSDVLFIGDEAGSDFHVIGGRRFMDLLNNGVSSYDPNPGGTIMPNKAVVLDAAEKVDKWRVDNLYLDGNRLSAVNTNGDLRLASNGAADIILEDDAVCNGSLTVHGNFTVQGTVTTTTVNSTNTTFADTILELNKGDAGSPNTTDIGFVFARGSNTNAAFIWDEGADEFALGLTSNSASDSDISISSIGSLRANIIGEIDIIDESSSTTEQRIIFARDGIGLAQLKSDDSLLYEPDVGRLIAAKFSGDGSELSNVIASQVSTATDTADGTAYLTFVNDASGSQQVKTNPSLKIDAIGGDLYASYLFAEGVSPGVGFNDTTNLAANGGLDFAGATGGIGDISTFTFSAGVTTSRVIADEFEGTIDGGTWS